MAKTPKNSEKTKAPMISHGFGFIDATPEPATWGQTMQALSALLASSIGDGKKVSTLSARGLVIEFTEPVTLSRAGLSGLEFQIREVRTRKSGGGSITVLLEPLTKHSKVRDDAGVGTQEQATRQVIKSGDPATLEDLKVSSAFRKGVAELRKMLKASGATLEEIGERAGIDDPEVLLRLPIINVTTAREFLGMTRQNLHRIMSEGNFDIGQKIDGQYVFSIEELAQFRQIPRRSGPVNKDA